VLPASISAPPLLRDTPWGQLTYLEYRQRLELGHADYDEIAALCQKLKIAWFASVWDEPPVDLPAVKAAKHELELRVYGTADDGAVHENHFPPWPRVVSEYDPSKPDSWRGGQK
jgi:hypothetical protein